MEVYRASPQHRAWCRISELEVRRASCQVEPCDRESNRALTDAELNELADLPRRFPAVAQHFANRNWLHCVNRQPSTVAEYRRLRQQSQEQQFSPVPKDAWKEAQFEAGERYKLAQRQLDYLETRPPKPPPVTPASVERYRESLRQKGERTTEVPVAENERD